MKRVFMLAALPVLLLALERVNLIKDAGFEKDSDVWLMRSEAEGEYDSTVINRHDLDSAFTGEYCGSIDTRTKPSNSLPDLYYMGGRLYQVFDYPKKLEDLDSLAICHMMILPQEGSKLPAWLYDFRLEFNNPSNGSLVECWYRWTAPDLDPPGDGPTFKVFSDTMYAEGTWNNYKRSLIEDFVNVKGLSPEIELDSFTIYGGGMNSGGWRGQKAFFDSVRLTGYADYDVGIKEILSGDSLEEDTPYTPIARIKNFGREDASDFSVIAEIFEGTTRVYYDSLPWSLTSDTEDTVTFSAFTPSSATNHTLTVRTVMSPDESDEDDEMTKTLYGSGIEEQPIPPGLVFEVSSFTTSPRASYSLPQDQQGTITLYDPTGRRVESLKVQGTGQVNFKPGLASGVYFVKLEAGKTSVTRKAVVLVK